jgi:hypothetical protein
MRHLLNEDYVAGTVLNLGEIKMKIKVFFFTLKETAIFSDRLGHF